MTNSRSPDGSAGSTAGRSSDFRANRLRLGATRRGSAARSPPAPPTASARRGRVPSTSSPAAADRAAPAIRLRLPRSDMRKAGPPRRSGRRAVRPWGDRDLRRPDFLVARRTWSPPLRSTRFARSSKLLRRNVAPPRADPTTNHRIFCLNVKMMVTKVNSWLTTRRRFRKINHNSYMMLNRADIRLSACTSDVDVRRDVALGKLRDACTKRANLAGTTCRPPSRSAILPRNSALRFARSASTRTRT